MSKCVCVYGASQPFIHCKQILKLQTNGESASARIVVSANHSWQPGCILMVVIKTLFDGSLN